MKTLPTRPYPNDYDTEPEKVAAPPAPASNEIDHPPHYVVGGIETWEFIKAKLTVEELRGYCKANILKYVSRAGFKHPDGGKADTLKAAWYMTRLTETYK